MGEGVGGRKNTSIIILYYCSGCLNMTRNFGMHAWGAYLGYNFTHTFV